VHLNLQLTIIWLRWWANLVYLTWILRVLCSELNLVTLLFYLHSLSYVVICNMLLWVHWEGFHLIPVIKHSSTELCKGESGLNVFVKLILPPCILDLVYFTSSQLFNTRDWSIYGFLSLVVFINVRKTNIDVTSEPVTDFNSFLLMSYFCTQLSIRMKSMIKHLPVLWKIDPCMQNFTYVWTYCFILIFLSFYLIQLQDWIFWPSCSQTCIVINIWNCCERSILCCNGIGSVSSHTANNCSHCLFYFDMQKLR